MTDPTRWAVLGQAIRGDRERQGLTREALAERVKARGGMVTGRTIITLEAGQPPKGRKPLKLEVVVAALGWQPGWTDRILAGEDPVDVLRREDAPVGTGVAPSPRPGAEMSEPAAAAGRAQLLELVPTVYEFSRMAARLGAPANLRDDFEQLVQEMLEAVSTGQQSRSGYGLAAYRPHAEGEGVPADDAARIRDALGEND